MFLFDYPRYRAVAVRILARMPPLSGAPIRIQTASNLRDRRGPVHAGAFLRERRIAFDCTAAEFPRIFVHETAHFLWLRLGNRIRHSWEALLRAEIRARRRGDLGWSADWRKSALAPHDIARRTRRWREYCCEAFCDTAACLWSGVARHPEFTLAAAPRRRRRQWFGVNLDGRHLSI
ncbi:MAG TPA: hypothetical protein VMJ75_04905 [Candidatus Acidoferrales bacterium]|nr:hypothetical protein [Candidatus Acidoferrales bacterium]